MLGMIPGVNEVPMHFLLLCKYFQKQIAKLKIYSIP